MSDPSGTTQKKVLHRKKHKNSRLGCPQCKQRRIKCDETLPSCKKCAARSIRCGYLDYSYKDLEVIVLAHANENDATDHKSLLLQPQQQHLQQTSYNPQKQLHPQQLQPQLSIISNSQLSQFDPQGSTTVYQHVSGEQPEFQQHHHHHYDYNSINSAACHSSPCGASVLPSLPVSPFHPSQPSSSRSSREVEIRHAQILTDKKTLEQIKPVSDEKLTDDESAYIHPIQSTPIEVPGYQSSKTTPGESTKSFSNKTTPCSSENIDSSKTTPRSEHSTNTRISDDLTVDLVAHISNKPAFDLKRFPEFLGETVPNTFARIFLLEEVHFRLILASKSTIVFKSLLLQGCGTLLSTYPELSVFFLKTRGDCMKYVLKELSNVTDSNSQLLLILTSILNNSSIFLKDQITLKDYFQLASGPGALLKSAFENPSKFPKSFFKLKNHADGLLFTAKYVWMPQYSHKPIFEFFEIVKEFGELYIENDDEIVDDILYDQYHSFVEFLEFCLDFLENEKSQDHVLKYPVEKVFELLQRWYALLPSECFTLASKTPPIQKVFYVFWFGLMSLLAVVLVGGRYIFTFFLDGYYLLHPFQPSQMLAGLNDDKLKWYINYSCRIIAFMHRRQAYIIRNTILNDPTPIYFDENDRFKARSLDIHERCITSFRDTVIKKIHYPMESSLSKNLINSEGNYYKSTELDRSHTAEDGDGNDDDLLKYINGDHYMNIQDDDEEKVDLLNGIDTESLLLINDYDPRYTDPIFDERIIFQSAYLDFFDKYIEDRKLIIQMGTS